MILGDLYITRCVAKYICIYVCILYIMLQCPSIFSMHLNLLPTEIKQSRNDTAIHLHSPFNHTLWFLLYGCIECCIGSLTCLGFVNMTLLLVFFIEKVDVTVLVIVNFQAGIQVVRLLCLVKLLANSHF